MEKHYIDLIWLILILTSVITEGIGWYFVFQERFSIAVALICFGGVAWFCTWFFL